MHNRRGPDAVQTGVVVYYINRRGLVSWVWNIKKEVWLVKWIAEGSNFVAWFHNDICLHKVTMSNPFSSH